MGVKYVVWGYSMVVNFWGEVIVMIEYQEIILYVDIDLDYVEEVWEQIFIRKQKCDDMYILDWKKL